MADEGRIKYQVTNHRTGEVIGSYFNKTRARNVVDNKDNEYGAYAHSIRIINPDGTVGDRTL